MASVTITYEIPMNQVVSTIAREIHRLEAGLNAAVDELLTVVENTQILKYTASAFPAPPPGSRYTRTFALRGASETRRTGTKLPDISGEWSANEGKAKHAPFVLGKRAQQARIHRGRWKSTDEAEAEMKAKAPEIIKERLRVVSSQ